MKTLSNGNVFHITGNLWGESTGHRWLPLTKSSNAEFDVFFDLRQTGDFSDMPSKL